jgi:hypothetical protein
VQTQNQRALLKELEGLLVRFILALAFHPTLFLSTLVPCTDSFSQQTVNVDREALLMLTNQSLEKRSGLLRLEESATELYKALIAGKDTGESIPGS